MSISDYKDNEIFIFHSSFIYSLEEKGRGHRRALDKVIYAKFELFVNDLLNEKPPKNILLKNENRKDRAGNTGQDLGSTLLNRFLMGNNCMPLTKNYADSDNCIEYSTNEKIINTSCLHFLSNNIDEDYYNTYLKTFWLNIKKGGRYSWETDILKFCKVYTPFLILCNSFLFSNLNNNSYKDIISLFRNINPDVNVNIYLISKIKHTNRFSDKTDPNFWYEKIQKQGVDINNIFLCLVKGDFKHDRSIVSKYHEVVIPFGFSNLLKNGMAIDDTTVYAHSVLGEKKSRDKYFYALDQMCDYIEKYGKTFNKLQTPPIPTDV